MTAIPRVFHHVWFGPKPYPEDARERANRWLAVNPGWRLKLWLDPDDIGSPLEGLAALAPSAVQKSDVARLEILRRVGGVYIDTDFEPIRPIEPLLAGLTFFCGFENERIVNVAIIGATPGHEIVRTMQARIPWRLIEHPDAGPNVQTGPELLTEIMSERPEWTPGRDERIFAREYFYPYYFDEPHLSDLPFDQAYAVHHWHGLSRPPISGIRVPKARALAFAGRFPQSRVHEAKLFAERQTLRDLRRVRRRVRRVVQRVTDNRPQLSPAGTFGTLVGPNELSIQTSTGLLMSCPADDLGVSTELLHRGEYEPGLRRFLEANVGHGATVVDVGANVGSFCLPAARAVGKAGRVLAIECNPVLLQHLRKSRRMNWFDTELEFDERAISDAEGEVTFFQPSSSPCLGGVVTDKFLARDAGVQLDVPCTTLDLLVDERLGPGATVDLLKIDVEGHEDAVLRGSASLLANNRVKQIVLEYRSDASADLSALYDEISKLVVAGARLTSLGWDGSAHAVDLFDLQTVAHFPSLVIDLRH